MERYVVAVTHQNRNKREKIVAFYEEGQSTPIQRETFIMFLQPHFGDLWKTKAVDGTTAKIQVRHVDGKDYVRTDSDEIPEDNLGELPEK
jgi:hypothetical protein